jgi:hypothetical protein
MRPMVRKAQEHPGFELLLTRKLANKIDFGVPVWSSI